MNKKSVSGIQVAIGFVLGVLLNVLIFWAGFMIPGLLIRPDKFGSGIATIQLYSLVYMGAVQLLWLVPLILLLRRKDRKSMALGVILAASLTVLLNATCWGFFLAGKIKIGG